MNSLKKLQMLCAFCLLATSATAATHVENFDNASGNANSYISTSGMNFQAGAGASGYIFTSTFNSYFSPYISGKAPSTGCNACTARPMTVSFPSGQRSIVFGWGTQNFAATHVAAYRSGQQVWQGTQSGMAMGGLYKQQFSHTAANAGEYFDSIVVTFPGGGQANTGYGVLLDSFTSTDAYAALEQTGDHQITRVQSTYASPLTVTVRDYQNHPVANVEIDFTAPLNGDGDPTATFAPTGESFDISMTDMNGVAVSSALTANDIVGSFTVQVTSVPSVGSAMFRMRNVTGDTIFAGDFE